MVARFCRHIQAAFIKPDLVIIDPDFKDYCLKVGGDQAGQWPPDSEQGHCLGPLIGGSEGVTSPVIIGAMDPIKPIGLKRVL